MGARQRDATEGIVLACARTGEHEFACAGCSDGVAGERAAEHEVRCRQHPGTVIGLARRGGELLGGDRLVTDEDGRTRQIAAGLANARPRQGIVTHGQGSARCERAAGAEREGHAAAEAIVISIGRAARAADGERGQGATGRGQILDAADRIGRRRAIGRGSIGYLHEELASRDDGVIARDVTHRIVRRGQAAWGEHARISASSAGRRVAPGDGQRPAESGGDVGLTGHEAGVARAIKANRIGLADETGVRIRRDGQRGLRDCGRHWRWRREGIIPGVRAAEREAGEADGLRGHDVLGVIESDGRAADRDGIRAEDTRKNAGVRDHSGRRAVIDLARCDGEPADGERLRRDGRRDGRGHRQRVIRGGRTGEGQAGKADGDRRSYVLAVIDSDRRAAQGDGVAAEQATERTRARDGRAGRAIVDLARRRTETGDGQRLGRDGRRDNIVSGDGIITRGGAAERQARETHASRGRDVLTVVITLGEAAEGDGVPGDGAGEGAGAGNGGRGGSVVDLAGRYAEVAQRERTRRDGPAHVAGRDDVVTAESAVGAVGDRVTDPYELTGADIGVSELTGAGGDDGLRANQSGQGPGRDGSQGRAVIDLVGDDRTRDGQRLRANLHGAGRAGERVGHRRRRGRGRGEAGVIGEGRRGQDVRAVRDGGTSQGDGRAVRRRGGQQGTSEARGGVVDLGAGDVQRKDGGVDVERALRGDLVIGRQGAAAEDADRGLAEGALVISAGDGGLGRTTGAQQRDRLAGQLARGDRELAHGEQARAVEGLGAGQRQRLRGDRGLVADDRRRDDVVAEQRAATGDHGGQRDARDVDAVGRNDIRRVVSGGGAGGEGDRVTGDESAGHRDGVDRQARGQRGGAVVNLRGGAERPQGKGNWGDGRGDGGRAGDGIIGELAAQRGAGERTDRETAGDESARGGDVGAVELHGRSPEGDGVTGEQIARSIGGDDGADEIRGAVIGLGDPDVGERDANRTRRNADRGGGADQGVVAGEAGAVAKGQSAEPAKAVGAGDTGAVRGEAGARRGERLASDAADEQVGGRGEGGVAVVDLAGGDADLGRGDGDRIKCRREGVIRCASGGPGHGDCATREGAALIGADIRGPQGRRTGAE